MAGAVDSYLVGEDIGMVLPFFAFYKFHECVFQLVIYFCIFFYDPDCWFKVSDMEEALEIPITNDLTMVLGSISQLTTI